VRQRAERIREGMLVESVRAGSIETSVVLLAVHTHFIQQGVA